jgi:hypothetical protein
MKVNPEGTSEARTERLVLRRRRYAYLADAGALLLFLASGLPRLGIASWPSWVQAGMGVACAACVIAAVRLHTTRRGQGHEGRRR